MLQILIRWLWSLVLFLFFTPVYGQVNCQDLFAQQHHHLNYRTPLIDELERNQRIDWVVHSTERDGSEKLWTLSFADNHTFYSMYQVLDEDGDILRATTKVVTHEIEKNFYILAGKYFESEVEFFKIPGIGKRFVHIPGPIQVKLLVKHGLTVDFIFETLKKMTLKQVKEFKSSNLNRHVHPEVFTYVVDFMIHGEKRTLCLIFEKNRDDPEMIDVVTAYFMGGNSHEVF